MNDSITLSQAARLLNRSVKTLQIQARKGKLYAPFFGPIRVVTLKEVERYRRENLRSNKPLKNNEETENKA